MRRQVLQAIFIKKVTQVYLIIFAVYISHDAQYAKDKNWSRY